MTEENAPWGKAGGAHKDSCEERLQAEDVCTSSWCISAGSISLENGLRSRNALGRTRVILAHDAEKRVKVGEGDKRSRTSVTMTGISSALGLAEQTELRKVGTCKEKRSLRIKICQLIWYFLILNKHWNVQYLLSYLIYNLKKFNTRWGDN